MTGREPSRASTRAAAVSDARPAASGAGDRLTRALVDKCALVFGEMERLPAFEDEERRERAAAFMRFVERVERGDVEPDARALAEAVVARGAAWLQEHPYLVPVQTATFGLSDVEAVIVQFNERTLKEPPAALAEAIAEDLLTFESVLNGGSVESGDAEHLAHAFVAYAHRWLRVHPGVYARYTARL